MCVNKYAYPSVIKFVVYYGAELIICEDGIYAATVELPNPDNAIKTVLVARCLMEEKFTIQETTFMKEFLDIPADIALSGEKVFGKDAL